MAILMIIRVTDRCSPGHEVTGAFGTSEEAQLGHVPVPRQEAEVQAQLGHVPVPRQEVQVLTAAAPARRHIGLPAGRNAFVTGFGATGNDDAENQLGHMPVPQKEAEVAVSTPPTGRNALTACPSNLQPMISVGPVGAKRAICGLQQLREGLPLFSFGSNGDFRFEDAVREHRSTMPVVIFDPTLGAEQAVRRIEADYETKEARALAHAKAHGYDFVANGIGYRNGTLTQHFKYGPRAGGVLISVPVETLPRLMRQAGHNDMGLLKIDASGEFEILNELRRTRFPLGKLVGILLLEIHMYHPQARENGGGTVNCCYGPADLKLILDFLADEGFVTVGFEAQDPIGCCAEFSFVNPGYPGFQK